MARNAEPFSPFVPWQIDDNPALFISVNVYDTLPPHVQGRHRPRAGSRRQSGNRPPMG